MNAERTPDDEDQEELVAFLDGELDDQAAREIETRLSLDPTVRAEADALKRTWDLLDYLPRPEPSADFTQRTLTRLNAPAAKTMLAGPSRVRRWLVPCGWAAAIFLAGAGGYTLTLHALPGPSDDRELVRELGVVENLRHYEQGESVQFLKQLDDPDLFGDPDS